MKTNPLPNASIFTAQDNGIKSAPSSKRVSMLSDLFKILGDPTRTRILLGLEDTELCVMHISELVGMSQSAVSHQLKTLKENNLVASRRDGKNVYYSLKDNHVTQILKMGIEHICEDC